MNALAEIEGLNALNCEESFSNPKKREYLSDTGAEVVKNTKELDEFVRSKRGRHNKAERQKIL